MVTTACRTRGRTPSSHCRRLRRGHRRARRPGAVITSMTRPFCARRSAMRSCWRIVMAARTPMTATTAAAAASHSSRLVRLVPGAGRRQQALMASRCLLPPGACGSPVGVRRRPGDGLLVDETGISLSRPPGRPDGIRDTRIQVSTGTAMAAPHWPCERGCEQRSEPAVQDCPPG
jgi:hypothetical protein